MGARIASGTWTAWNRLGIDTTPKRRESDSAPGTCYRDSRGRWVAEVTIDGRRHRRIGATERAARDALTEVLDRIDRGLEARSPNVTVADWMEHVAAVVMPTAN